MRVSTIFIMEMHTLFGPTELSICGGPTARSFEISLKRSLSILVLQIEVDDDMFIRYSDVVKLTGVNI